MKGVQIPLFLLSSFVLNPHRSSEMWVELFACSAFVALLIPFFDSHHCYGEWIKGM
jgi:hypothetical protein